MWQSYACTRLTFIVRTFLIGFVRVESSVWEQIKLWFCFVVVSTKKHVFQVIWELYSFSYICNENITLDFVYLAFELDTGVEFELDAEFNGSFLFIGLILCLLCRHYVVFYAALHSYMIFLRILPAGTLLGVCPIRWILL